ncbi:MAG: hypothetical protein ACQETH_05785 [Candidatus Rifleibacteriota bacterium]
MRQLYSQLQNELHLDFHKLAHDLFSNCNFQPPLLHQIKPQRTLSVSVTADHCEQNCSHCQGHYLKSMTPVERLPEIELSNYDSILVSGGSNKDGSLNISALKKKLLELPEQLTFNIHPGFQSPENLLLLKKRKAVVSLDLPVSNKVIRQIFRLPYDIEDYRQLYLEYQKHFTTIPHINLGLDKNAATSEKDLIDFLALHQPVKTVFILFRPTPGTEMAHEKLPDIKSAIKIISYARKKLDGKILVGCMRPAGSHRKNFDILAWLAGIQHFVMPDKTLVNILKKNNAEIIQHTECCCL